jgi:hypothetical protein
MTLEEEIKSVSFFRDFMTLLHYIKNKSIKLTAELQNISLGDLAELSKIVEGKIELEYFLGDKKYKLRNELEIDWLHQARIIAQTGGLVQKYKGTMKLSRLGKALLHHWTPTDIYLHIVETYFEDVDWRYFYSYGWVPKSESKLNLVQDKKQVIWEGLLKNGQEWISREEFEKEVGIFFDIDINWRGRIFHELVCRNLTRFGLVETQEEKSKYGYKQVTKFRLTKLGETILKKQLEPKTRF